MPSKPGGRPWLSTNRQYSPLPIASCRIPAMKSLPLVFPVHKLASVADQLKLAAGALGNLSVCYWSLAGNYSHASSVL